MSFEMLQTISKIPASRHPGTEADHDQLEDPDWIRSVIATRQEAEEDSQSSASSTIPARIIKQEFIRLASILKLSSGLSE